MSKPVLKIEGYTLIPPEILEVYRENCQLTALTIGCIRNQLKIPDAYAIIVNGKRIHDLAATVTIEDQVAVLPTIAGGTSN